MTAAQGEGRARLPRFQLIRMLGDGGEGRVFLASDRERASLVAIKRVLTPTSESLLRLKAEFRTVSELRHPGLVRLYELGQDDQGLYFTMEPIDGTTLDCHLGLEVEEPTRANTPGPASARPPGSAADRGRGASEPARPELDRVVERFAPLLPQILEALDALHQRGLVHRDLKPNNIMVGRQGEVRLLDFGILAALGTHGDGRGTAEFMAPEQVQDAVVSPASDLYSLGVLLFWLLAGRVPFSGAEGVVLDAHVHEVPPRHLICGSAPPALVDCCLRLLAKDPAQRPDLAWIDAHVLAPLGWRRTLRAPSPVSATQLFGRDELQARLASALPSHRGCGFRLLVLRGPSGIGKTRLLDWLAERAQTGGALVLRGRARAHERIPFNALDAAVDGLARVWIDADTDTSVAPTAVVRAQSWTTVPDPASASHDARLAALRQVAASAFPVFASRHPVARASSRVEAFVAVAALLAEAARPEGLLLTLDDLQWADRDSLALLDSVVAAAPGRVLVVGALRDEPEHRDVVDRVLQMKGALVQELTELPAEALAQIIDRAARRQGACTDSRAAADLIAQCDGRPMLAEVIGRGLAASRASGASDRPLEAVLDSLTPSAHAIVAALHIASRDVAVDRLGSVIAQSPGEIEDQLWSMASEGIVRIYPVGGRTFVDLYHDLVRTAVGGRISPADRRAIHGAFADRELADPRASPEQRARHLWGAGRLDEAAPYALEAAERARARLAFGLAAEMYEIAIAAGTVDRRAAERQLAICLEHTGRFAKASAVWQQLARDAEPDERAEIAIHEATCLLGAADVEDGYRRLDLALRQLGAPRLRSRGLGALWDAVRFAAGPRLRRWPPQSGPPNELALQRAARDRRLGVLTTYFDSLTGVRFLLHARDSCDRIGARDEAARCDYTLSLAAHFREPTRRQVSLAERYRAAADARIVGLPAASPATRAFPLALEGVSLMRSGRFDEAEQSLEQAIQVAEDVGSSGTTEHLFLLGLRGTLAVARQRLPELEAQNRRLGAACDAASSGTMRSWRGLFAIELARLRGDRGARDAAWTSATGIATPLASSQDCVLALCRVAAEIRDGDPRWLAQRAREIVVACRRFRVLSSMYVGLYLPPIAIVEARAVLAGDPDASARATARYAAVAMAAPPFAATRALRAAAYVRGHLGDVEAAVDLLAQAETEAARWGQVIDAAVARYQRGKRLRGDAGAELCSQATRQLADAGAAGHWLDEDEV